MITECITRYRCSFCRRRSARRKAPVVEHERHCFRNPARVPWVGELTSVEQEGKLVNFGTSPGLPDGMAWLEWVERLPPWWPGSGKIWDGVAWRDVPGYKRKPATGVHGCAGGAPDEETWPEFDGQLLPLIKPPPCRLALLFPVSAVAEPF